MPKLVEVVEGAVTATHGEAGAHGLGDEDPRGGTRYKHRVDHRRSEGVERDTLGHGADDTGVRQHSRNLRCGHRTACAQQG